MKDKTYGRLLESQAQQNRPNPTFVDDQLYEDAKCPNCNDRGFITAFFAAFNKSAQVGTVPLTYKDQVMTWINGAWWVGQHRTYPCPVCRTELIYHDGRG